MAVDVCNECVKGFCRTAYDGPDVHMNSCLLLDITINSKHLHIKFCRSRREAHV